MSVLKRWVVGTILALVLLGVLAGWFVARTSLVEVGYFSHLTVMPDDSLLVPVGEKLLHILPSGHQRIYDRADLRLTLEVPGKWAPVSANSFYALETRARGSSMLKYCELGAGQCRTVATVEDAPRRGSRLFYSAVLSRFLLVDNAGDRLLWLNGDGEVLDEMGGLRFPNGVVFEDQKFWLVDSNHHRVLEVSPDASGFGAQPVEHRIASSGLWRWPVELHKGEDGGWLVQIARDGMSKDRFVWYSETWEEQSFLELPDIRDVVSSALVGKRLWLAGEDRMLYWSEPPYTQLEPLADGVAANYLDVLADEYRQLQLLSNSLLVLFFVLLVVAFVVAWRLDGDRFVALQRRTITAAGAQQAMQPDDLYLPSGVAQDIPPGQLLRWHRALVALSLLMAALAVAGMTVIPQMGVMLAPLVFVFIATGWLFAELGAARLQVHGSRVRLMAANGRVFEADASSLRASASLLMLGHKLVMIGQPRQRLFDDQAVCAHLEPLIREADTIPASLLWRLLQHPDNRRLALVYLAFGLMVAVAALAVLLDALGVTDVLAG